MSAWDRGGSSTATRRAESDGDRGLRRAHAVDSQDDLYGRAIGRLATRRKAGREARAQDEGGDLGEAGAESQGVIVSELPQGLVAMQLPKVSVSHLL